MTDTAPSTVWIKADGKTEIEINDEAATIAYAESLGWTRKGAKTSKGSVTPNKAKKD